MNRLAIMDSDGCLTEESVATILKNTEVLECACPQHLLKVLQSIRDFQEYETGCIIRYPKDAEIHSWLLEESKRLEVMTTKTIVELMRKENIIDKNNYFCPPVKS